MRVCIAIPTYRRPEQLRQLLDALAAQDLPAGYIADVVVLDNDREPSAEPVVREFPAFGFGLQYRHVAEPGLCVVRNFALRFARDGHDFLAMIDDDEVPCSSWLSALLDVQAQTQADGVIGPVEQRLPAGIPGWLKAGKFYDLPSFADKSSLDYGYSGNCLLSVAALAKYEAAFASSLNFAGGEDMFFFQQFVGRGARLVYAAKAFATEDVPISRSSLSYLLRLYFRRGNTLAFCDRALRGSAILLLQRFVKAAGRLLFGGVSLIPLLATRGRTGACIALLNIAHGAGGLVGLLGHVYNAYKRDDSASV
ncbi:MAG: hypothetical protein NVS2B17_19890 [Candidatus Velthaea sp.]